MTQKEPEGRFTRGTAFALTVTAIVIVCCAALLLPMLSREMYIKPDELLERLDEARAGVTPLPDELPTAVPEGYDGQEGKELTLLPETTALPEKAPVRLTIAAAGTVYAPRMIRESVRTGRDYDFTPILSGLGTLLGDADVTIATLETMAVPDAADADNYCAPSSLLSALRDCGVDIVNLSTERMLDKGYAGLDATLSELTARGMTAVGAKADGLPGCVMRVGDVEIAVLGYAYGLSSEGERASGADSRGMLALLDEEKIRADIAAVRAAGARLVIVLPHWGTKNRADTPETLRRQARRLAEAGADIILGTHANVVQGTERLSVQRSDGLTHEALVCYSLGCLLTDARTPENTAGIEAEISVEYDPATRRVTLGALVCSPIYIANQKENGKNVYIVVDVEDAQQMARLSPAEQEAAKAAAEAVREITGQSQWESEGEG